MKTARAREKLVQVGKWGLLWSWDGFEVMISTRAHKKDQVQIFISGGRGGLSPIRQEVEKSPAEKTGMHFGSEQDPFLPSYNHTVTETQ